jgi:hypothetical protein
MGPLTRAAVLGLVGVAACVPADQALPLGSLEFDMKASHITTEGIPASTVVDGWAITVDRALLALKTITIGETGDPSKCSYRGRGQQGDVVFDPRYGNVQIFNGVEPDVCPDVGFVLQPPDSNTIPGAGATGKDLQMLAEGNPAHAYLEMTATSGETGQVYQLTLRFETDSTPSRFGGCQAGVKGVQVVANQRIRSTIAFAADAVFRQSIDPNAALRFLPFKDADDPKVTAAANGDGVITMAELDALPLDAARRYSDTYQLQDGSTAASFGTFVREQLKFAFFFDEDGACVGDDPGTSGP